MIKRGIGNGMAAFHVGVGLKGIAVFSVLSYVLDVFGPSLRQSCYETHFRLLDVAAGRAAGLPSAVEAPLRLFPR